VRRVVVAGGGIAGLSLAFGLTRLLPPGDKVLVLEREPRAGGNIRTETLDGYLCEWGPNGFLDNVHETFRLISALGLDERVVRSSDAARRRYIYRGGRLHEVPAGPGAFLSSGLLSWRGKLRIAWEPFAPGPPGGDETIYGFASRRIGREAADALVDPMVSGVFAGNARELSLRACFAKMAEMEAQYGGLFKALVGKMRERRRAARAAPQAGQAPAAPGSAPQPMGAPTGALTSFVGGTEELIDALAAHLGPALRLETTVTAIARQGTGWRVRTDRGEAIDGDALVLGTPAGVTADLLAPLDPPLARTLRAIPSAPLAVVCLGYDEAEVTRTRGPLDGFGFLVPRGEGLRILGALWDSSVYPGRAPSGRVLIRAMIGGAHDRSVLALSDEELLATVRTDLRRAMHLGLEPSFVRIFRHPLGIPQYTVGHLDRLADIDSRLAGWPGLFLAGNAYRGPSINACVADADRLAAATLGYLEAGS
jgi:protoporphyrinogen/coproporphyrinogen III oxidase